MRVLSLFAFTVLTAVGLSSHSAVVAQQVAEQEFLGLGVFVPAIGGDFAGVPVVDDKKDAKDAQKKKQEQENAIEMDDHERFREPCSYRSRDWPRCRDECRAGGRHWPVCRKECRPGSRFWPRCRDAM